MAADWENADRRTARDAGENKVGTAKSLDRATKKAAQDRATRLLAAQVRAAERAKPQPYIESAFEKSIPLVPFDFKPVAVTAPKTGKVYVVAGIGPALYEGEQRERVADIDVVSHRFVQLYSRTSPITQNLMPKRLAEMVRELVPVETIKAAIFAMRNDPVGLTKVKPPTGKGSTIKNFLGSLHASTDPGYLAGSLRMIFMVHNINHTRNYALDAAIVAENMLAGEYAYLTGRPFEEALRLVAYKSGYKEEPGAGTAAPSARKPRKTKSSAAADPAP